MNFARDKKYIDISCYNFNNFEYIYFINRMTTSTSKFVTAFDVFAVVVTCSLGVSCGICCLRYTTELNRKLKEVN